MEINDEGEVVQVQPTELQQPPVAGNRLQTSTQTVQPAGPQSAQPGSLPPEPTGISVPGTVEKPVRASELLLPEEVIHKKMEAAAQQGTTSQGVISQPRMTENTLVRVIPAIARCPGVPGIMLYVTKALYNQREFG